MSSYNLHILSSIADLRENSALWDDLLKRSSVATPLARAELIAQWVERFAPDAMFRALVVESQGRFLAALPIVGTIKAKVISAGMNPSNEWAQSGQLLIDFQENPGALVASLVGGFRKLPFSILWFDYIREHDPEWVLFRNCIASLNFSSHWLTRYPTGVVNLSNNVNEKFDLFNAKQLSKIIRKYHKYYENINYKFLFTHSSVEILSLLNECYKIEDKGWKGQDKGGSIIKRDMKCYINRQASILSKHKNFYLFILSINDKIVSFLYGIVSKNILFMLKSSYDPEFKHTAPGQVLMYLILSDFCKKNNIFKIDFVGELMQYQLVWNPIKCANAQVVIPLRSFNGELFYHLYDTIMPLARRSKKIVYDIYAKMKNKYLKILN